FELIPNGIDTDRFSPRPELRAGARAALGLSNADIAIGIVASLTPEKAHRVLIDAVARLRADGLPLKLVIAGEGGERANIEAAIANAGLSDSIRLLGLRRDLERAV